MPRAVLLAESASRRFVGAESRTALCWQSVGQLFGAIGQLLRDFSLLRGRLTAFKGVPSPLCATLNGFERPNSGLEA